MKFIKYTFLLLVVLKLSASKVNAQIDTVFWFAAPWVTPDHDGNVQMAFRISTFGIKLSKRVK